MKRTLTAFYQTKAEAEKVKNNLEAARMGAEVKIVDKDAPDAPKEHRDFIEWIGDLFVGHDDKHAYGEAVKRGHILLTAKVDELNETRAAEILDGAGPVDFQKAQRAWRDEGWTGRETTRGQDLETVGAGSGDSPVRVIGVYVRSYPLRDF